MDYSFHPAAEAEFNDSIDYYESIQPGLGIELADEVLRAMLIVFPTAFYTLKEAVGYSSLQ